MSNIRMCRWQQWFIRFILLTSVQSWNLKRKRAAIPIANKNKHIKFVAITHTKYSSIKWQTDTSPAHQKFISAFFSTITTCLRQIIHISHRNSHFFCSSVRYAECIQASSKFKYVILSFFFLFVFITFAFTEFQHLECVFSLAVTSTE